MGAHTPGPWTVTGGRILGGTGAVAKMIDQSTNYKAQQEADANLIAAAPDLLAVAESIVLRGHSTGCATNDDTLGLPSKTCDCLFDPAESAIAKARGES